MTYEKFAELAKQTHQTGRKLYRSLQNIAQFDNHIWTANRMRNWADPEVQIYVGSEIDDILKDLDELNRDFANTLNDILERPLSPDEIDLYMQVVQLNIKSNLNMATYIADYTKILKIQSN